jgi:hypothetical protein
VRYLADRTKALWQGDAEAPTSDSQKKLKNEESGKASELKSA